MAMDMIDDNVRSSLFHPDNATFLAEVSAAVGGLSEIARASDDPDKLLAAHFGVRASDLASWVLAKGRHSCAAVLSRRRGACQRLLAKPPYLSPQTWASSPEAFCKFHLNRQA